MLRHYRDLVLMNEATDNIGEVKAMKGNVHPLLGNNLEFPDVRRRMPNVAGVRTAKDGTHDQVGILFTKNFAPDVHRIIQLTGEVRFLGCR